MFCDNGIKAATHRVLFLVWRLAIGVSEDKKVLRSLLQAQKKSILYLSEC